MHFDDRDLVVISVRTRLRVFRRFYDRDLVVVVYCWGFRYILSHEYFTILYERGLAGV